jgi:hypothetical protein
MKQKKIFSMGNQSKRATNPSEPMYYNDVARLLCKPVPEIMLMVQSGAIPFHTVGDAVVFMESEIKHLIPK